MNTSEIKIGYTYILNNNGKNNGRECIVLEFIENCKAKAKFIDNGRIDKVLLNDLKEVIKESREEKLAMILAKRHEIKSLIETEYEKISHIEKKIEEYRIELLRCDRELNSI